MEENIMKERYPEFLVASVIYAIISTIFIYKNPSGITSLFYVIASLIYILISLKKLNIVFHKESFFYFISIFLLGFSLFLTDNKIIIVFNYMGIYLLSIIFLIHLFYHNNKWGLEKQLSVVGTIFIEMIAALGTPISYAKVYRTKSGNKETETGWKRNIKYILIGLLISIPLLFIIIVLLVSADRIFGNYFIQIFENIVIPENVIGISFMLCMIFFTSFALIAAMAKRTIRIENTKSRNQEPLIAITFSGILAVIYLVFCQVQIMGLFLGKLRLPEDYTYAAYAREGFFQLFAVSLINYFLVVIGMIYFKKSKILKGILTIISVCTFILIASSAYRMILYIKAYQWTFLRFFVLWALLVIFLLMLGTLIHIFNETFLLFQYSLIVVTVLYIGLSYSHPDYLIAKENIKMMKENDYLSYDTNYLDLYYLYSLSSDAAPVIIPYLNSEADHLSEYDREEMDYYLSKMRMEYSNMDMRSFNVSRYIAGRIDQEQEISLAMGAGFENNERR